MELIERVRAGETEAYGELVRKYQDRLFNTCWRICGHLEDARDITQDAFLKAFEELARFRSESGFYTWLFRIAVNLALSRRRKAGRTRTVSLHEAVAASDRRAEHAAEPVAHSASNNPAGAASEAELQGRVARALHNLDDEYRAVIVLRDMEGFGYQEIGDILGIPSGTVKSRLHRARAQLYEAIRPALAPEL